MTAPAPHSQPDNPEVRQEVAAIHRVGEIVVELNDCGFENAVELIDTLTKQRDAAEYRVEELTKALEWRPIETAPKDGTPMLLCYWEGSADVLPVTSGFWSRLGEEWFSEISGRRCKPTHWMPLPTYSLPLEQSGSGK